MNDVTGSQTEVSNRPRVIEGGKGHVVHRSEEHTSELQSRRDLVCRLLLEKKKKKKKKQQTNKKIKKKELKNNATNIKKKTLNYTEKNIYTSDNSTNDMLTHT